MRRASSSTRAVADARRRSRPGTRTRSSTSCASAPSSTATATASATFAGLTEQARLPAGPRRHRALAAARSIRRRCATTATTSPTTPTSTPTSGTLADFEQLARRGAPPRPARHHRAGAQPHLRPAPVVPARAARAARLGRARLLRLERHARPLPRRAHHLQGLRAVELGLGSAWPRPTTGTASTRTSPT